VQAGDGNSTEALAHTLCASASEARDSLPFVAGRRARTGSPTAGLLLGLVITLTAVVTYSWYITRQMTALRALQADLADRNRKDSLQLLRIQNDLNSLGLAMRDMLDTEERYPLTAWSAQFDRVRLDLDDALRRQAEVAVAERTPEQRRYLAQSVAQFWDASDRIFGLAKEGKVEEARAQIRLSLQARQAALSTAVARLLVENNESEEQASERVQAIDEQVARQVYWFLLATLTAIVITSAYLIRSNRRLFAELALVSNERRQLAQNLIEAQESTLRQISRELHDEFGQVLTAIGSLLRRAGRHVAADSPMHDELREVGGIAQTTLGSIRSLSQTLHPSILEELGLDSTVEWYLSSVDRQLGIAVTYERSGTPTPVDSTIAIQVYRVLQEALNNVARHAGADRAWVRLRYLDTALELEVEDHGKGIDAAASGARGLGLVAMRERAELVDGTIEFLRPEPGGLLVRLVVPLRPTRGGQDHGSPR
jgi:signal transduction histidine kinase